MRPIRIAVDVMSGDRGMPTVIAGVFTACKETAVPLQISLCGNGSEIRASIKEYGAAATFKKHHCSLKIVSCTQIIPAAVKRARAWKIAPDSSVIRCISLQQQGMVDASVSAGDTGVLMSAALFLLGRDKKYSRPALAALLPTIRQRPVLVLDVGANLESRCEHLVDFAHMGCDYLKRSGNNNPSVGLLNIGIESNKGPKPVREAAVELIRSDCTYAGFIEGSDVLTGRADVVVCDGFAGNVLLKACGSFHHLVAHLDRQSKRKQPDRLTTISILNPDHYGAVPLLGINGAVLKAHGSSSAGAIANAVKAAAALVQSYRSRPLSTTV